MTGMLLKTLQKLISLLLILLTASLTACLIDPVPRLADIVREEIDYNYKINGRVDFVGMQTISHIYYYEWPVDGPRNVLSLFISKLDMRLREKLHVVRSYDFYGSFERGCLFTWRFGEYEPFLFKYQESVNDSLSWPGCGNYIKSLFRYQEPVNDRSGLYPESYRKRDTEMVDITLSQIKKYSYADYFLLIAIKPFELYAYRPKNGGSYFIVIIYNRDGKKIYSKIYEDNFETTSSNPNYFFYSSTIKLLENQGEQISNDLMFLLTADDAPSPTLEDLHNRLQQPGTIYDDVEYLKGFQNK